MVRTTSPAPTEQPTEEPTILVTQSPTTSFVCNCSNVGVASTFAVLGSTFTNTVGGTTITGDVGYTTPPAVMPTVIGSVHVADATYNQAGLDQASQLAYLNSLTCTFIFSPGAIDLATDVSHGTLGVYTPGIYCVRGAATIGTSGLTLSGVGTFLFRINGAFTTVVNSQVTVATLDICNIFWTPTQATTLGANSGFAGTIIDASGITIGNNINWPSARALAFGGTVSISSNIITLVKCPTLAPTTEAPTQEPTGPINPTEEPTTGPPTVFSPTLAPGASPVCVDWFILFVVIGAIAAAIVVFLIITIVYLIATRRKASGNPNYTNMGARTSSR